MLADCSGVVLETSRRLEHRKVLPPPQKKKKSLGLGLDLEEKNLQNFKTVCYLYYD